VKHQILGFSVQGRPLEALQLTTGPKALLLLGGVHGDEPEGYTLVERFVDEGEWSCLEGRASLWVIPRVNPDGCVL
jgi:murein tripeptide amidase MpaA